MLARRALMKAVSRLMRALSAASEIALRRPEDACACVPVDESDNLSGASSKAKVCAVMRPVAVSRFRRFKSARMSEAFW